MNVNALMMNENDNVVTCVADIHKGDTITYLRNNVLCTLTAEEDIPYCHKVAIIDVPKDGEIIKYGESLGKTSEAVSVGHWISHNNLFSVPRDYDNEMI